jgi:hypothetical protein
MEKVSRMKSIQKNLAQTILLQWRFDRHNHLNQTEESWPAAPGWRIGFVTTRSVKWSFQIATIQSCILSPCSQFIIRRSSHLTPVKVGAD